ncbi:TPA: flagellar M-ring protein FliF [Candidatus Galligastranaerophilus intestinavium]|uniref:Flagellar M-ring protein n=1 Tax=Candidatus Galligastranaerophilus intestinavium TaxID=2840836 RepID=A0A9D1FH99_9BACT|nr:flagellar M-ring protein FliF [Candidatus Galligastranaerophilus intestinavium]
MNEQLKAMAADIKKIWDKFDLNQKFIIAALLVVAMVVCIYFIFKATEPNWSVLYSDLSRDDVAAISESLKKSGYAFKLSDDKSAILVREQDKENLRIYVAENDLIKDSTPGFELLDDLQLGSTDFKNKLTKQRIFQGELTRSIEKINGIQKARVQLAEPERSVFSDDEEEPSASVILILEPGYRLKPSQILAIKNLVAYSVPRLTNDRVFLTDQNGNALSEDVAKNNTDMQSYRSAFEKEAAKKIKDTLETIMGKDNVSVQVSAVMDFNSTRSTIESYVPAGDTQSGVILGQQSEKEVYKKPQPIVLKKDEVALDPDNPIGQNQQNAQGVNIQNANAQNPQTQNVMTVVDEQAGISEADENARNVTDKVRGRELSYEKEKNAVNYAVTKEVKQVVYAPGAVTRLSVAVAVNKILTETEEEDIKNLVIAAAGMDISRGDVVNVSSLKFMGIDKAEQLQTLNEERYAKVMEMMEFLFSNVAPLIVVLILGILGLTTFSSIFKKPEPPKPVFQDDTQYNGFDPYLMMGNSDDAGANYLEQQEDDQPVFTSVVDKKRSEITDIILSDPQDAARLLTSYIKE